MINKDFILVVPCYNEEARFKLDYFQGILDMDNLAIVFVNDGSTDKTKNIIEKFVLTNPSNSSFLNITRNSGKANAVRIGMLHAFQYNSKYVGFLDADGAFPTKVVWDCLQKIRGEKANITSFWFSRVKLAGSEIERNWKRHYLGRIVATLATNGLPNCPYDTQAGFKVFSKREFPWEIWEKPFRTEWLFDVEMFLRLSQCNQSKNLLEVPVSAWRDIKGSKIKTSHAYKILLDLIVIQKLKKDFRDQKRI